MTSLSEEIAAMYHLICLSRGIVPERIILRRTVSHCQKETEVVEESGIELASSKLNVATVAESSVLSLVQVSFLNLKRVIDHA